MNHDSTIAGFKAILEADPKPKQPFRFLYMSGVAAFDPDGPAHSRTISSWVPKAMKEQCLMRVSLWSRYDSLPQTSRRQTVVTDTIGLVRAKH